MDAMTTVLASIIGLFVLLLPVKRMLPVRFAGRMCALCLAVSMTWAGLLGARWLGVFQDTALLALLMGSTVLGVYYTVEDRVRRSLQLFRLPFYLTLVMAAYMLVTLAVPVGAVVLLAGLWTVFGLLFLYRENDRIQDHVDAVIDCCGGW